MFRTPRVRKAAAWGAVPVTGAQEGGGWGKGLEPPPPPLHKPIFPHP